MGAYYNEIDKKTGAWLQRLANAGHVPAGRVDVRSIADVQPKDIGDGQAHFFAGVGGWPLALRMAGVSDNEPVWSGSCPCQPFSVGGLQRGESDERHLWPEFRRLVEQRKPTVIFGEQVASRSGRTWLSSVRNDLEALGYAVGASDLCAAGAGYPHIRQRLFWGAVHIADASCVRASRQEQRSSVGPRRPWGPRCAADLLTIAARPFDARDNWPAPLIRPMDDGVPGRVVRLRSYGNAIVPELAALFVGAFLDSV